MGRTKKILKKRGKTVRCSMYLLLLRDFDLNVRNERITFVSLLTISDAGEQKLKIGLSLKLSFKLSLMHFNSFIHIRVTRKYKDTFCRHKIIVPSPQDCGISWNVFELVFWTSSIPFRCQFHQRFTLSFFANIFDPKIT